jgi:hypothetical protein
MAHPVRQCAVALNASLLSEEPLAAITLLPKLHPKNIIYPPGVSVDVCDEGY